MYQIVAAAAVFWAALAEDDRRRLQIPIGGIFSGLGQFAQGITDAVDPNGPNVQSIFDGIGQFGQGITDAIPRNVEAPISQETVMLQALQEQHANNIPLEAIFSGVGGFAQGITDLATQGSGPNIASIFDGLGQFAQGISDAIPRSVHAGDFNINNVLNSLVGPACSLAFVGNGNECGEGWICRTYADPVSGGISARCQPAFWASHHAPADTQMLMDPQTAAANNLDIASIFSGLGQFAQGITDAVHPDGSGPKIDSIFGGIGQFAQGITDAVGANSLMAPQDAVILQAPQEAPSNALFGSGDKQPGDECAWQFTGSECIDGSMCMDLGRTRMCTALNSLPEGHECANTGSAISTFCGSSMMCCTGKCVNQITCAAGQADNIAKIIATAFTIFKAYQDTFGGATASHMHAPDSLMLADPTVQQANAFFGSGDKGPGEDCAPQMFGSECRSGLMCMVTSHGNFCTALHSLPKDMECSKSGNLVQSFCAFGNVCCDSQCADILQCTLQQVQVVQQIVATGAKIAAAANAIGIF